MELKYRNCMNSFSKHCHEWIKEKFGEFKKDRPVSVPHDYHKSNEICKNCNNYSFRQPPEE